MMKKGFLLTALLVVSGSAAVNAQKADTPMSQVVELGLNRAKSQSLILADEPTGNLDKKAGDEIVKLLEVAHEKYRQTIILVTHDISIAQHAQRIITFEDGKIIKDERRGEHEDSSEAQSH